MGAFPNLFENLEEEAEMLVETHILGEFFTTRYRGKDLKYALVYFKESKI